MILAGFNAPLEFLTGFNPLHIVFSGECEPPLRHRIVMAEIKSTLELTLERTKKFTLSEKDKEEIKQKEIQQKIMSLFHRYREGHLHLNEIQKEIERMDEKAGKEVKEGLLSLWIDGLSLDEDDERFLRGIESLKHRNIDEVKVEFRKLITQCQTEKERIKREVRTQLSEALRKEGFGGDAVEPNIEASDPWEKASVALDQEYQSELRELKGFLRTL
ncbi:MAG: hypothetical protein A2V86_06250 [Deltaproteobacteria bacterium RBG_16_49_23]|nr:MAG: hypothetical protein A2V86_06250 [Deltaproteobacteria bacterium RBG_16_49_23]